MLTPNKLYAFWKVSNTEKLWLFIIQNMFPSLRSRKQYTCNSQFSNPCIFYPRFPIQIIILSIVSIPDSCDPNLEICSSNWEGVTLSSGEHKYVWEFRWGILVQEQRKNEEKINNRKMYWEIFLTYLNVNHSFSWKKQENNKFNINTGYNNMLSLFTWQNYILYVYSGWICGLADCGLFAFRFLYISKVYLDIN